MALPTTRLPRGRAVGIGLVIVSACAFGSGALFAKPVYAAGLDWMTLLAWRFGFAALASWLWLLARPADRRALRRLSQGVRQSDNAEAKAMLTRGEAQLQSALQAGDREAAQQARGVILQSIVRVFPGASARIGEVVRTGLERARTSLGTREAPRIRAALDEVAALLRRAVASAAEGRTAVALDLVLQAAERLDRLAEFV